MDVDEDNSQPIRMGKARSTPVVAQKEESKGPSKPKTFLDRCKEVGRLGPRFSKLDPNTASGTVKIRDENSTCCDLEAIGQFCSIRANTAVFKNRYYFEVKLMTSGLMQIGWCTLATAFLSDNGVGDDETSYAYDGYRVKRWNRESHTYGEQWAAGDVIGTLINFDTKEVNFYRNETTLGVAFKNIKTGPNMAYFPAISLGEGQRVIFNFGLQPFVYRVISNNAGSMCSAVCEPECFVKNYCDTGYFLMEFVKRYIFVHNDFTDISEDMRLMVGCLLLEYLHPLVTKEPSKYLMEYQLVHFFFEMLNMPSMHVERLTKLVLDLFEIYFTDEQLQELLWPLMTILCRKVGELKMLPDPTL